MSVQRMRFEHPEVGACADLGKDNGVSAPGPISHAGRRGHAHKVNFCKFTNETRKLIEDARPTFGQTISRVNGACAGGGYELALAWTTSC